MCGPIYFDSEKYILRLQIFYPKLQKSTYRIPQSDKKYISGTLLSQKSVSAGSAHDTNTVKPDLSMLSRDKVNCTFKSNWLLNRSDH